MKLEFYGKGSVAFSFVEKSIAKILLLKKTLDDEDGIVLLRLSASIRALGGGKHLRAICSLGDLI